VSQAHEDVEVRIFLMADAASCAVAGQTTPNGCYNIERMMKFSIKKGAKVKICGSCAEARGLKKGPTRIAHIAKAPRASTENKALPKSAILPTHRCLIATFELWTN
jgi:sulfur relay (sulfurtransferase) complex TusBCD TusD component (DsrE family)